MSNLSSMRRLFRFLVPILGIALLSALILRTGVGSIIRHGQVVGWGLVLIIALGGFSHLIRTWAWRLTFRSGIRDLSLARTFALRLISEAIGTFGLPGMVAGDAARVSLLGPAIPLDDRISSIALDRGIYTFSSAVVSIMGMIAAIILLSLAGAWRVYALVFVAAASILLALTLVMFAKQWRILSVSTRAAQGLPWVGPWLVDKISLIETSEENLLGFRSRAPKSFWGCVFLSLGAQVLAVAEVYLVLRFMGVRIPWIGALVIEAFTKLINVVGAVNPGNVGTYEGGNLVLARLLGFTTAAGLTLALCRRARTLFWAGIGALCLVGASRDKERKMLNPLNGSPSENRTESQPAPSTGRNDCATRHAPAVIILVEPDKKESVLIPALARVGTLPVLLRAILSAQALRPAQIVVSVPVPLMRVVRSELRRTGRLPEAVEWRERAAGSAISSVMRQVAPTAGRIVLLSGTNTYKPVFLQLTCEEQESSEAVVVKTGNEPVGIFSLPRESTLRLADQSQIDTFQDLDTWLGSTCSVTVKQVPGDTWQSITSWADNILAERKLDKWLVKPTDGMFACMNRRISIPISRQLINVPLSPNVITLLILGVSIAAGVFFARGGYGNMLFGAFLSVWASILDGCDGEVARLKLQSSEFGCWLDTICDYLYYVLVFAGITVGLTRSAGSNAYLAWGGVLLVGAVLSFLVVSHMRRNLAGDCPETFLTIWQKKAESQGFNPLLYVGRHCEFIIRRCFFPYALLAFALLNATRIAFIATAVGANLVWSIALYSSFAFSGKQDARRLAAPIKAAVSVEGQL